MVYCAVEQRDAACGRLVQAQGKVEYGPFGTPFGRIAICRDPMGTAFSLILPE